MKTKNILLLLLIAVMTISCKQKAQTYLIKTTEGDIKIMLYDKTPLHKANFENLVKNKTYDGTIFHRVIEDFMIQGGNPTLKDPSFEEITIPAEFVPEYYHKKGALAAARMGDTVNPEKRSSVQFYIVQGRKYTENELKDMEDFADKVWTPEQKMTYRTVGGTPFLDQDYTVFGEVIEGLDIVDKIASVMTDPGDKPMQDVEIIQVVKK